MNLFEINFNFDVYSNHQELVADLAPDSENSTVIERSRNYLEMTSAPGHHDSSPVVEGVETNVMKLTTHDSQRGYVPAN